jgi:hypothetical protein
VELNNEGIKKEKQVLKLSDKATNKDRNRNGLELSNKGN